MKNSGDLLEKSAFGTGTGMIFTGVLILGPVGFLLLLTIFYSMMVQNLALGLIAGLMFFSPLIFLLIWAPLKWSSELRHRLAFNAEFAHGDNPVPGLGEN